MSKKINLLIKKSKKSNQKAQMQLYDLYCEAMFTISCRYLKNQEEANRVYDMLAEQKLTAYFKESVKLNDKEISYDEFVALAQG